MPKNVPMRMCVVCRTMRPKNELVRIVKSEDTIALDLTGKMRGRGAYICKDINCIKKCVSKKFLNKVFDCLVDDAVYQKILNDFTDTEN